MVTFVITAYLDSQTWVLQLPQDDPEIIEGYLEWHFTSDISHYCAPGNVTSPFQEEIARLYTLAAKLYVFGDKVQDFDFANLIIDETYGLVVRTKTVPLTVQNYVYDNTPEKSGYRRLQVDLWLCFILKETAKDHIDDVPTEFKDGVVLCICEFSNLIRLQPETWAGALCKYHKHEEDTQQPVAKGMVLPSTSENTQGCEVWFIRFAIQGYENP